MTRFLAFVRRDDWIAIGIALVLAISCESTPKAGLRRQEEWRLRTCVCAYQGFTKQCIVESVERCRDAGLEASCGVDGLSTQAIVCSGR